MQVIANGHGASFGVKKVLGLDSDDGWYSVVKIWKITELQITKNGEFYVNYVSQF